MTLRRTIQRREKRQRAKQRRTERRPGPAFLTPDWVTGEVLANMGRDIALLRLMSRPNRK